MKLLLLAIVALFVVIIVNAQSAQTLMMTPMAATVAGCTWPSGFTGTNVMALCPVSTGTGTGMLYYAVNGGTFQPLVPAQNPGIKPSFSCSSASLGNSTPSGLSVSGCQ